MNNSSTKILIVVLFMLAVLSGYNYFQRPFLKFFQAQQIANQQLASVTPQPTFSQEQQILDSFSTKQKIWQLVSLPVSLENNQEASQTAEMEFIYEHQPGFVTIFGSKINMETVKDFTQHLPVAEAGFVPLVAVDHEGGTVQRLAGDGFLSLPSWAAICQESTGEKLSIFEQSARELRSAGVNIVFAPVVDVPREGSFLKTRACKDQLDLLSTAEEYIKSFGEQGILAVVKHYPGIGSLTKDLHFYQQEVYPGSQDTTPFERLFSAFPNIGVMSAHVIVPDRTAGLPCSLSKVCLDPFPVHFPDVIVFVDALEMESARITDENGEEVSFEITAKMAINAGNDVLVFGEKVSYDDLSSIVEFLATSYEQDEEFKATVDQSLLKILDLKIID